MLFKFYVYLYKIFIFLIINKKINRNLHFYVQIRFVYVNKKL